MCRRRLVIVAICLAIFLNLIQMLYVGDQLILLRYSYTDAKFISNPPMTKPVVTPTSMGPSFQIDRIVYFNSFLSADGNDKMKAWLSSQHIPFHRIENLHGGGNAQCQKDAGCLKSSRIFRTYQYLLDSGGFQIDPIYTNELESKTEVSFFGGRPRHTVGKPYFNLTGTTLVFHEDSIVVQDVSHLQRRLGHAMAKSQIPSDWEVIRLKCCTLDYDTAAVSDDMQIQKIQGWGIQGNMSEALLWRDSSLYKFKADGESARYQVFTPNECLCINNAPSTKEPIVRVKGIIFPETKVSLERILLQNPANSNNVKRKIERVYYNNLDKNKQRQEMMDFWLNEDSLRTVPYKRIAAQAGDPLRDECIPGKNETRRCIGVAGLAKTLIRIMDEEETEGISLILEDDYCITDPGFQRMEASLALVPDDWDLIRFDCWKMDAVDFLWINPFVAKTNRFHANRECKKKNTCWFCGGTHALLVRDKSLERVKKMWGKTPYDDVDCVIGKTPWLNSYCVNIGVGDMYQFHNEITDIPKN